MRTEASCGTTAGDSASVDVDATTPVQLGHGIGAAVEKGYRGVELTLDGAATTARPVNDEPAVPPCEPSVAAASDGGNPSHLEPAVDQPTPGKVLLDHSVDRSVVAAVDAPTKPGDAAGGDGDARASAAGTGDVKDASERSRPSTTVGRAVPLPSSAARHALPSAVAAPRATGKHRLPPVLVTSAGQGHGLERTSPLPLVVGSHHPTTSPSLMGGTRLGDLGLPQPPPLNLSVVDEAVNMKVVGSTTTTRSAADSGSRAGTYSTHPRMAPPTVSSLQYFETAGLVTGRAFTLYKETCCNYPKGFVSEKQAHHRRKLY